MKKKILTLVTLLTSTLSSNAEELHITTATVKDSEGGNLRVQDLLDSDVLFVDRATNDYFINPNIYKELRSDNTVKFKTNLNRFKSIDLDTLEHISSTGNTITSFAK